MGTQELETIKKAVAGDGEAFAEAVNTIKIKLYRVAYAIVGSESEAIDALDEAIFSAYKGIRKLREPKFFSTWLTRIVINQCNAALRMRKREIHGEYDLGSAEFYDSLPIKEAVRRLPYELRVIVGLRFFADLTIPVVAEMLNLPQGTVKSRQRKALALLKVELANE
jgi:RNA polymerase sigma-70 factor (ECF subfamily)